jgi:cephalosporin-C deacetylase
MPFFDFPLEQLQTYLPERVEQPDFDAFWEETLSAARQFTVGCSFRTGRFRPEDGRDLRCDV